MPLSGYLSPVVCGTREWNARTKHAQCLCSSRAYLCVRVCVTLCVGQ